MSPVQVAATIAPATTEVTAHRNVVRPTQSAPVEPDEVQAALEEATALLTQQDSAHQRLQQARENTLRAIAEHQLVLSRIDEALAAMEGRSNPQPASTSSHPSPRRESVSVENATWSQIIDHVMSSAPPSGFSSGEVMQQVEALLKPARRHFTPAVVYSTLSRMSSAGQVKAMGRHRSKRYSPVRS